MTIKFQYLPIGLGLMLIAGCASSSPPSCAGVADSGRPATRLSDGKYFALSDAEVAKGKSLAELMCAADRGDPSARLALGVRYETGEGVAADPARAAKLYESAARDIAQLVTLNSPPTRSGRFGVTRASGLRPLPIALAEARYRLGQLYLDGRGVTQDRGIGRRLLIEAARQGYQPALTLLDGKTEAVQPSIKPEGLE
jgi:hypothetical protein